MDTCPFLGPLISLFWTSGGVSTGFQSQIGQPYWHLGEPYASFDLLVMLKLVPYTVLQKHGKVFMIICSCCGTQPFYWWYINFQSDMRSCVALLSRGLEKETINFINRIMFRIFNLNLFLFKIFSDRRFVEFV